MTLYILNLSIRYPKSKKRKEKASADSYFRLTDTKLILYQNLYGAWSNQIPTRLQTWTWAEVNKVAFEWNEVTSRLAKGKLTGTDTNDNDASTSSIFLDQLRSISLKLDKISWPTFCSSTLHGRCFSVKKKIQLI